MRVTVCSFSVGSGFPCVIQKEGNLYMDNTNPKDDSISLLSDRMAWCIFISYLLKESVPQQREVGWRDKFSRGIISGGTTSSVLEVGAIRSIDWKETRYIHTLGQYLLCFHLEGHQWKEHNGSQQRKCMDITKVPPIRMRTSLRGYIHMYERKHVDLKLHISNGERRLGFI